METLKVLTECKSEIYHSFITRPHTKRLTAGREENNKPLDTQLIRLKIYLQSAAVCVKQPVGTC